MADHPRIEELRRRVEKDPASIAFAQLAEELRRAGDFAESIRVCRAGLEHHPGYLSARVTLGRALLATGQYEDAQVELEQVVRVAPDNLAAIRALAEIHQQADGTGGAQADSGLLPADPVPPGRPPDVDLTLTGSDRESPPSLQTFDAFDSQPPLAETTAPAESSDPVLAELEEWLAAIRTDRETRKTDGHT